MEPFQQQNQDHQADGPDDPFLGSVPLRNNSPRSPSLSSSAHVTMAVSDTSPDPHDPGALDYSHFGPNALPSSSNEADDQSRSILGMLDPRPRSYPTNKVFDMLTGGGGIHQAKRSDNVLDSGKLPQNSLAVAAAESAATLPGIEGPSSSIMIDINQTDSRYRSKIQPDNPGDSDDDGSSSPSPSLIRHHTPRPPPPENFAHRHPGNNLSSSTATPLHRSLLHEHRSSVNINPTSTTYPEPLGFMARARETWNQERARYTRYLAPDGHIQLDEVDGQNGPSGDNTRENSPSKASLSPRDVALWRWVNLDDLDAFLQDVYGYYCGKGIWAIALARLCSLMTVGFVIGFSTFLVGCIDYSTLRESHHLEEVIIPRCVTRFSGLTSSLVLCFGGFYVWKVLRFSQDIAKLWQMHEFFANLLEVSEVEIQTIPWHGLVDKLAALKHQHPSSYTAPEHRRATATSGQSVLQRKLDAHDVANQIMREENYLIALFNKDILDLRPPLPSWMSGNALIGDRQLTKSLEWNLVFCLRGYLLDQRGQVKYEFLDSRNKAHLAAGLRRRFILMGIINAILAPFIVIYVLLYSFFRYFEEYHQNPSSIGSRNFTKLAQWKFREYNELPHLFQSRLFKSYSISKQYVDQFPKTKTSILAKFVSFVAGSFAAVLILLSIFDPDAFLHFQITKDRSVLFYIGLFGSILAISRGMIPKEYEESIETPEVLMQHIVQHTHYLPTHWYGKLHSLDIYTEFCELFQLKVVNFLRELMSVLLTPFILWYGFSDQRCERIVDFFREFTIHVDGIGHVCSFAVFDFSKLGNVNSPPYSQSNLNNTQHPPRQPIPTSRMTSTPHPQSQSDVNKMERSLLSFVAHHPNWEPSNQTASLYLSKAIGFSTADSTMHQSGMQPQHINIPPLNRRHSRLMVHSSLSPNNGGMTLGARSRLLNANALAAPPMAGRMNNSMMVPPSAMRGAAHRLNQSAMKSHHINSSISPRRSTSVGSVKGINSRSQSASNTSGQGTSGPSQVLINNSKLTRRQVKSAGVGVHDRRPMMGVEAIDEEECEEPSRLLSDDVQKKWAGLGELEDDEDPFGVMASETTAERPEPLPVDGAQQVEEGVTNLPVESGSQAVSSSTGPKPPGGNLKTILNEVWNHDIKKW
ncbi:autophagy protein Apg9-domain-containing protein [Melampsora americana]|nr:autophagy protein Apg9-domain-containing protein [Melampsora americana]